MERQAGVLCGLSLSLSELFYYLQFVLKKMLRCSPTAKLLLLLLLLLTSHAALPT
jgi:hypothetical protein